MPHFKRSILEVDATETVSTHLQQRLADLIDLALQLKQAHWCVIGNNFRAVHLQLDEIIEDVRATTDEIAERIASIGVAPDGRAATVAEHSKLPAYPKLFVSASETVNHIADRLDTVVQSLRESIGSLGEVDPISEDMLIAISAGLEKHLWMVQAQEA